ncbi:hypothetical protein GCM10009789_86330 [Kribbella sancticallisti]|uniref:ATP-grasp domain-containing protein n=1 Tax=Kribbella sancticallisti TaxID=460087 RepID=A0ABP4QQV0_9ACTN
MALVIIGPSAGIVRAAVQGAEPLVLVGPKVGLLTASLRPQIDELFTCDYTDEAALFGLADIWMKAGDTIRGVVSVTEEGLLPAARLAVYLGVPGLGTVGVRATRDKLEMRSVLGAATPRLTVRAVPAHESDRVLQLLAEAGTAVLKPVDGTASADVHLLTSPADYRAATQDLRRFIVEEYVTGVEVSVESMSSGGDHDIVAIAEKRTSDTFVEVAHLMPPVSLSDDQLESVRRAVREALTALRITDGPAHTELMVGADRVTIIESHTRPGGDGIADLVRATVGIDWRLACTTWPLGRPLPEPEPTAPAAAIVFFTAPPGVVRATRSEPPVLPGVGIEGWFVDVAEGDVVGPLRSSKDRLGAVRLTAESTETCAAAVDALLGLDVVVTDEGQP